MELEREILPAGSQPYYNSLFFSPELRGRIFKLYSFVRLADDYVDQLPQNIQAFNQLKTVWQRLRDLPMRELQKQPEDDINTHVVKNICRLVILRHLQREWVDAFLESMASNTKTSTYATLHDTLQYVHGSAEVVGLMAAKLMDLPETAMGFAAAQGRAVQWITFLRDIVRHNQLGRTYFPQEDLKKFGLKDLQEQTVRRKPEALTDFVHLQLERYHEWQNQAAQGFYTIGRRQRVAVQAAVDGYNWTARQIAKNPLVIYDRQLKPGKPRLVGYAVGHLFD